MDAQTESEVDIGRVESTALDSELLDDGRATLLDRARIRRSIVGDFECCERELSPLLMSSYGIGLSDGASDRPVVTKLVVDDFADPSSRV